MEKTPKIRVMVNEVSVLGTHARAQLIQVVHGIAHYRCKVDRSHLFSREIEDPFASDGPAPEIKCDFMHSEVAL